MSLNSQIHKNKHGKQKGTLTLEKNKLRKKFDLFRSKPLPYVHTLEESKPKPIYDEQCSKSYSITNEGYGKCHKGYFFISIKRQSVDHTILNRLTYHVYID